MKIVLPTLHVRRSPQAVPLAAGCLAAALPAGVRQTTTLLDFYPEQSEQEILNRIIACQPDLVAFPVYLWNRAQVIHLARQLRAQDPDLTLVAGGPEVTGDPDGFSADNLWDALILGEGEKSFAELVRALTTAQSPHAIPGICWQPQPGAAVTTEPVQLTELDSLSSPWLSGMLSPTPEHGVLWEVARGCAFACDYCFDSRGQAGVRTLNRERLVAELELFKQTGVDQVWVLDSTFNYPPERGVRLLELLLEHAPHFHYHFEAKTDYIDRQTVSLLSHLYCSVQLGVQSIQKQVLQSVHRPLDLSRLRERVHLLASEGVTYGFDLIFGLPGDNYAGFCQSVDTVFELSPNHLHIFPLSLLPGTRLARQADRHNLVAEKTPPYEITSSATWSPADLQKSRQLAAAIDIFYNTGRAVAFFPSLVNTLETSPTEFFEDLIDWMLAQPAIDRDSLLDTDAWSALDAYRLQQEYLSQRLRKAGLGHLVTAILDLLCYHFNYAETLLGEGLQPISPDLLENVNCWDVPWRRATQLRMAPFAYEVYDLLEAEEMELQDFVELFRPVGSVAVFMRRGHEVVCESLGEDFLRLLKGSDGRRSPREIFAGTLSRATGEELVAAAVAEGMLQPPSSADLTSAAGP